MPVLDRSVKFSYLNNPSMPHFLL